MCGFIGSFNTLPGKEKLLEAFNCINYRGDLTGLKRFKSGIIMATRLSRTGLSHKPQPIVSKKGNILVFNGEIYNYKDLAKRMGINHSDHSDSEILMYWLEKHNSFALPYLVGEFSFVYIKPKSNQLYMVRDPFGTKPLYYCIKNKALLFGSSPKSVSLLSKNPFSINLVNSSDFLNYGLAPEGTVYSNVFFAKPGFIYRFENGNLNAKLIERKKDNHNFTPFEEIETAINRRILSYKNECAIAYSGGIDSTIIKEIANKKFNDIKIYHLDTNAEKIDSKLYNDPNFHIISVNTKNINEFNTIYFEAACRPVTSFSGIGMTILNYHAKKNGAKIILSGECADEIFCGYPHYFSNSQGHPIITNRNNDRKFLKAIFNNVETNFLSETLDSILNSKNPNEWLLFDRNIRLPEHLCLMNCDIPSLLNKIESRLPYVDLINFQYEVVENVIYPKDELIKVLNKLNIFTIEPKKGLHVPFSILNDNYIVNIIKEIPNQSIISELVGIDILKFKVLAIRMIKKLNTFPVKYQSYLREILTRYIFGIYSFSFCLKKTTQNTMDEKLFIRFLNKENYSLI